MLRITFLALTFRLLSNFNVMAQTTAKEWSDKGFATNDYTEEITFFTQAIKLDPKHADAFMGRGWAKNGLGRYREAITDFDLAIQLKPNDANAHIGRGYANNNLRKFEQALVDFNEAVRLDARDPIAFINRGNVKYSLHQYEEAITDLDQALKLKPDYAKAHIEKGRVLVKLGLYEQALSQFKQGEDLDGSLAYHRNDKKLAKNKLAQLPIASRPVPSIIKSTNKRYALVIGNSAYRYGTSLFGNPINDANDIAERLRQLGFTVAIKTDADKKAMERSLREFSDQIQGGEVALFFYSGHGMEVNGVNYLLPIDVKLRRPEDANNEAINVQAFIERLKNSRAAFGVAVLDACRNNPFTNQSVSRGWSSNRGFVPISNMSGLGNMYLAMATGWNSVANNGSGRNGVYTSALLNYMRAGQTLDRVLLQTSVSVTNSTNHTQNPQVVLQPSTENLLTF